MTTIKYNRTAPNGDKITFNLDFEIPEDMTVEELIEPAAKYLGEQWGHRNVSANAYKNQEIADFAQNHLNGETITINLRDELNRSRAVSTVSAEASKALAEKRAIAKATGSAKLELLAVAAGMTVEEFVALTKGL